MGVVPPLHPPCPTRYEPIVLATLDLCNDLLSLACPLVTDKLFPPRPRNTAAGDSASAPPDTAPGAPGAVSGARGDSSNPPPPPPPTTTTAGSNSTHAGVVGGAPTGSFSVSVAEQFLSLFDGAEHLTARAAADGLAAYTTDSQCRAFASSSQDQAWKGALQHCKLRHPKPVRHADAGTAANPLLMDVRGVCGVRNRQMRGVTHDP